MTDLERLRAEYKKLTNSLEFAYAMGHGCTLSGHPTWDAIRQRAANLRAQIKEHTP